MQSQSPPTTADGNNSSTSPAPAPPPLFIATNTTVDENIRAKNYVVGGTEEEISSSATSLYASYFFAAWGDRMWEFAAIVFLLEIFPNTLFPPSLFGFCENAAGIAFGSHIGTYIDFNDRLRVIRTSIIGQNVTLVCAAVLFCIALLKTEDLSMGARCVVLALIILAGMIAKCASSLNKISIHKDWAVVVANKDTAQQTKINSAMRRVDLTCSILAPLAVGVLSSGFSPATATVFIALWSFCSIFVELHLSKSVYDSVPALQMPKPNSPLRSTNSPLPVPPSRKSVDSPKSLTEDVATIEEQTNCLTKQMLILSAYYQHPAFAISLPYCLLYISCLSFGGTMVAFLRSIGCSDFLLAAGRGIAALVAIGATFAIPKMVKKEGLCKTGLITIWLQIACLVPLIAGFLLISDLEGQMTTGFIILVFFTVCSSRFGLWGFDLAQTQLMQEMIDPEVAGRINGGQEILMNFCYLISFATTMVFSQPSSFAAPAFLSFDAVLVAATLYSTFYAKKSKQIRQMGGISS